MGERLVRRKGKDLFARRRNAVFRILNLREIRYNEHEKASVIAEVDRPVGKTSQATSFINTHWLRPLR